MLCKIIMIDGRLARQLLLMRIIITGFFLFKFFSYYNIRTDNAAFNIVSMSHDKILLILFTYQWIKPPIYQSQLESE